MVIDYASFTPAASLVGGLMIGAAVAVLLLFNGRIAGISGILGGLFSQPSADRRWRVSFLAGLVIAPVFASLLGSAPVVDIQASWGETLLAGLLVGVGTRYAGGCTSGHGVCGLSRGSVRSIVATMTFMAAGFVTIFIQRHLIGIYHG